MFCTSVTQVGFTALMSATIGGKTDVVTDLIALGADSDIENPVS